MKAKPPPEPTIPLIRPIRRQQSSWEKFRAQWIRFWTDFRSQFSSNPLDRCRWKIAGATRESTSEKPKDQLGRAGEDEAVLYLEEKGLLILARNFRIRDGEIDIIAIDGRTLAFIEVKTRRTGFFGSPFKAVKPHKMKRLVRLADSFASQYRLRGVALRFDILDVVWPEDEPPQFQHIVDAFRGNDLRRY